MRKHQQRQILDILQTLHEAQAVGMFADCQDAAIGVGEFIESIAGEGTQTVALLEEYCELLFQASKGETSEKQLRKQLISIENSVKNELKPDKIEIAFLPYNLSMWDSLESIYLAAKDDPDCDAYVVPLPYYDFDDETKTLGEKMHYDGDKYPENIPVTHWQTYDIEERRPDIIFIHYAYDDDGNNFSVPPEFYSRNLRQHCELLIYVPYYVSREEWIPQFFADLPGVLNSHHVIVQSEAVRQVYIDHFNKSAKEYGFGDKCGKAKDKFLALGSPKFDKVINTNSEDCPLPEKWERLITKPDGEIKKIVLYNTHMFAWINNAEQYFIKIRSILNIFKNRDDVVLWWRPHPGTELNFQKHLPEMLGDYYAVVNEYQEGNVGIYDDTPDLHRAIAWSDAYYGDSSSVEVLYATTGKPMMKQNVNYAQDRFSLAHDTSSYVPLAFYADETNIWFLIKHANALFIMSRANLEVQFVGKFPNEVLFAKPFKEPMYRTPVKCDGVLYFPPFQANEIAIYRVIEKSFEKVSYRKNESMADKVYTRDFFGAVSYGDYIYFTPYRYPAIIRLNKNDNHIEYCTDWVSPLTEMTGEIDDAFFLFPLTIGNDIWLASCGTNAVVKFDMSNCVSTIYEVGKKGYRYNGICFDGENFWLSPRRNTDTPIIKWNCAKGTTEEVVASYAVESLKCDATIIVHGGGFVWLFPSVPGVTKKIDVRTNTVSVADEFVFCRQGEGNSHQQYSCVQIIDDTILACDTLSGLFVEYNLITHERKGKSTNYSANIVNIIEQLSVEILLREPRQIKTMQDCIFRENNKDNLYGFCNYLIDDTITDKKEQLRIHRGKIAKHLTINAKGAAGQAIYEYAKKVIL